MGRQVVGGRHRHRGSKRSRAHCRGELLGRDRWQGVRHKQGG